MNMDEMGRRPVLGFSRASVAICLLLDDARPPAPFRDDEFTYHQHDFIAYASRDDPPFVLEPGTSPTGLETVTCLFPTITYRTAGDDLQVVKRSGDHPARAEVARVFFWPSRMSVLVVMLEVAHSNGQSGEPGNLSEFDVIRLAKLWEGGEATPHLEATRGSLSLSGEPWVQFESRSCGRLDFAQLIDRVRMTCCPEANIALRPPPDDTQPIDRQDRPYVTGCLQLQTDELTMSQIIAGLRDIKYPRAKAISAREEVLALSGVLRALLAFRDTYPNELPSIFRETVADRRVITAVHKGTFLRVAEKMRMPSAYFLLPHVIALHNEALLDKATQAGAAMLETNIRLRRRGHLRPLRWASLEETRRLINSRMDDRIDGAVIHYPNLRELYERASGSRGLNGRAARAQRYADELRVEANTRRTSVQAWAQVMLAAVAVVVAVIVALR